MNCSLFLPTCTFSKAFWTWQAWHVQHVDVTRRVKSARARFVECARSLGTVASKIQLTFGTVFKRPNYEQETSETWQSNIWSRINEFCSFSLLWHSCSEETFSSILKKLRISKNLDVDLRWDFEKIKEFVNVDQLHFSAMLFLWEIFASKF